MSDVTPRILVEYTLKTPDGEIDDRAYEAITPRGTLNGGKFHGERSLGYAEFEPNTQISRYTDKDEFLSVVRKKAEYIHVKDVA